MHENDKYLQARTWYFILVSAPVPCWKTGGSPLSGGPCVGTNSASGKLRPGAPACPNVHPPPGHTQAQDVTNACTTSPIRDEEHATRMQHVTREQLATREQRVAFASRGARHTHAGRAGRSQRIVAAALLRPVCVGVRRLSCRAAQ
eukprot:365926-Chlamydomonas_euryale.AAC.3